MSVKTLALALTAAWLVAGSAAPGHAQLAIEDEQDGGILNPIDFSYRAYLDTMTRFPDRVGIVCGNAYLLDKAAKYDEAFPFFTECAKRGNPPSMVYLSYMYDHGRGTPVDPAASTYWVKRAAEAGYQTGQYHYGLALLNGYGTATDVRAAKLWLERAAEQGDVDAARVLRNASAFQPLAAMSR